jgi:hypothetical protein
LTVFGSATTCLADITLSYTISDGSNAQGHSVSATENSPIGTPVAGGTEYDFSFGPVANANWNWLVGFGTSNVSLIEYGPQDDPTGARLFLSGSTSAKPFTVTYKGPDRRFSDQVQITFSATFSPLSAPLANTAGLDGNINSLNPKLTVNPSMVATATGSGNFGTVNFGSTLGPKAESMGVNSLQGVINFTWNNKLQINGDSVTFTQAYVQTASVPEPSSFVLAACAVIFGLGAWLRSRRRHAVA